MIVDENTTRLLVSEALKEKLSDEFADEDAVVDTTLSVEFIVSTNNDKFSVSGPLLDFERNSTDSCILIQFRASITDAYEIFSLTKNQTDCKCTNYLLSCLNKKVDISGPFLLCTKQMTNFNYKTNQCTICIELIKTAQ